MKKFTHLPLGETFEFQGKAYLKTGPLTARSIDDNSQRMIPRSAVVRPLTEPPPAPVEQVTQRQLQADRVLQAFAAYHEGCLEWLKLTEEADAALAARIREAMEQARQRFLADMERLSSAE